MSDYLTQFQAKTSRKADAELIRRWEWDARCNGEKNIKIQIANAKRTATSLQKVHQQFSNLRPEHELAMNAERMMTPRVAQRYGPAGQLMAEVITTVESVTYKFQEIQAMRSLENLRTGETLNVEGKQ